MYIYYNIEKQAFVTKEFLQPKGKITTGKIGTFKFCKMYDDYYNSIKNKSTKLNVLRGKMMTAEGEIKTAYQNEIDAVMNEKVLAIPRPCKMTQVRMRVIGHDNGNTIVEPSDKRMVNILIKLGYFNEISEES